LKLSSIVLALASAAALAACSQREPSTYQGYAEGEFVHVASPVGGRLDKLLVARGQTIAVGAPLFELESQQESAGVAQADENLRAAESRLADLGTGKRSAEIDVTQAQLEQATAAAAQSDSELTRDQAQFEAGGISKTQLEAARAKRDVDAAKVRELTGQLDVARLAARPDQIKAQSSDVAAAKATLAQAQWKLDQKKVVATRAGLVFDTLFREGEWVPAGSPIVRMLPPENIKIRFFVPEAQTPRFKVGQGVTLKCDGCAGPIAAAVTYVAAEPEYTPPIIYSNETRAKLVFMIEAKPEAAAATSLRPGQPVQVAPR
jgi:HlyD family secretion protein